MNVNDVAQLLLAAGGVAGALGAVVATYQSRAARRRLDAETDKLDADSERVLTDRANTVNSMALSLLQPMHDRIASLTADVRRLENEVNRLTDRLRLAQHVLDEHHIPFPPIDDDVGRW